MDVRVMFLLATGFFFSLEKDICLFGSLDLENGF